MVSAQAVLQTKAVTTQATTPDTGFINTYDATAGQISATLPALSDCGVGANLMVQKTDTGANPVVFTRSGSDVFDDGTTQLTLTRHGEARTLQVVSLDEGVTKMWKVVNRMTAQAIPTGTRITENFADFDDPVYPVPPGVLGATVTVIGGGAGGGSGRRGALGTYRNGGGGGGGGGFEERSVPASMMGATVTIHAGAPCSGGDSQTTDDSDGHGGNDGNTSWVVFAGGFAMSAPGGSSGVGGTGDDSSTAWGGRGLGGAISGGTGGRGNDANTGGSGCQPTDAQGWVYDTFEEGFRCHAVAGGGGGGGAGVSWLGVPGDGGAGAGCAWCMQAGGAAGVYGGAAPTSGSRPAPGLCGGGGGGGCGIPAGSGQPGATATGFGGGGGGGGGATNGYASGAGGGGGPGHIRIVWEY